MADTQDQITNLDAELDALSSPTTADVYARSRDYDADVVAASAVARAAAGGGSLPAGGTTGQVLTKASNADGDADWEASGGGSSPLTEITINWDDLNASGNAPLLALNEGQWLTRLLCVITAGFNDSSLSGVGFAIDDTTDSVALVGTTIDISSDSTVSAANVFGFDPGGTPFDVNGNPTSSDGARLPVRAGAGGMALQFRTTVLAGDGNAGQIVFLAEVVTPS